MINFHPTLSLLVALIVALVSAETNQPMNAIAYVEGSGGLVKGTVTFTQVACGEPITIRVMISGLTPGKHGFHVHEKGDLTNGCASTGSHYNPDGVDHGSPDDKTRHVGDLGNIVADSNGNVNTTIVDKIMTLSGSRSIIGRGLVVHENEDDLGRTSNADSKKTGNAGGRVACGVIGVNTVKDMKVCSSGIKISSVFSLTASLVAISIFLSFNSH